MWDKTTGKSAFSNVDQDKTITLLKGKHEYDRRLKIPANAAIGNYVLGTGVWYGVRGHANKSQKIANGPRIDIAVVA